MDDLELNELVRSLTSDDPALSDEEISKWAERKHDLLVLVLRFLCDYGYNNSYEVLCTESFMHLEEVSSPLTLLPAKTSLCSCLALLALLLMHLT